MKNNMYILHFQIKYFYHYVFNENSSENHLSKNLFKNNLNFKIGDQAIKFLQKSISYLILLLSNITNMSLPLLIDSLRPRGSICLIEFFALEVTSGGRNFSVS